MRIYFLRPSVIPMITVMSTILLFASCSKGFLDKKPDSNIIQPNTTDDLQGLLDDFEVLNSSYPALPHLSCDEYYYLSKNYWQGARTATERHSYIWDKDVYGGENAISCWNGPYATIFVANNVIESAAKIRSTVDNEGKLNNIKGAAHFFRAFAYYELVKSFSKAYDEATAPADLGVPLKLGAAIDEILPRATLKQCYEQILSDLTVAKELMIFTQPDPARNRPSKLAAYALFSRIYLSMRKYDLAYAYSDSTLDFYDNLIDYNTVSTTSSAPFSITNEETIFFSRIGSYNASAYRNPDLSLNIDTVLLSSYAPNDLRKGAYFTLAAPGIYTVRRGYNGSGLSPFNGLAIDEVYLIKAECAARSGNTDEAMNTLNKLLVKRYKTGTFVPLVATSSPEALQIVLMERRKELVWRGLRWDDLKRFNMEGANISLTRNLDGQIYTLPPNDPRWVFNIPQDEINFSGIEQNQR